MKKLLLPLLLLCSSATFAQDDFEDYKVNTLFNNGSVRASGGYGALTNKLTTIDGKFVNIAEVYGGWYLNHRFLFGLGVAASTNDIRVPEQFRAGGNANDRLTYQYGQGGFITEYVIGSSKTIHLAFQLFTGVGFTLQYNRHIPEYDPYDDYRRHAYDEDYFFVAEPGVKLEVNFFKWMRFCPGVSYRSVHNSHGKGLSDDALSAISYNATLKFGKF